MVRVLNGTIRQRTTCYLGGRGNIPNDVGVTVSHKLFAPRAGLAYRMGDKTVIRTGYGLNYDPIPFSRAWRGFYPLTINADTVAPNSFAAASTLASGIPPVTGPDLSTGIVPLPGNASERSPWAGELHRGYVQSWNFTVERRLPLELVTSVGVCGAAFSPTCLLIAISTRAILVRERQVSPNTQLSDAQCQPICRMAT